MSDTWKSARQIAGYKAQVQGALNTDRTGSEIAIDIATARALVEICDQAIHTEEGHKQ